MSSHPSHAPPTAGGATARALALGALVAASFAVLPSAASAATYIFDHGSLDHGRAVTIDGIGEVRAGAYQLDGARDGHAFTDLVAFCVDVYHRMRLGDYTPGLEYTDTVDVTTDSDFVAPLTLSAGQRLQMARLINYGVLVFSHAPTGTAAQRAARWDELADVQGAIWQVVSGRDVTSTSAPIDGRINDLSSAGYQGFFNNSYGVVRSNVTFLTPQGYPGRRAPQTVGGAGVPEPASWALMILGFGAAGAMFRRRRRVTA